MAHLNERGKKMEKALTLGLGNIHAEKGEIRAFLPPFVEKISRCFEEIILEEGYGDAMGITPDSYTKPGNIRFAPVAEVYAQDFVLVLRYPDNKYLELMPPGSCLISMCHFPTRPNRRGFLRSRAIEAISLDSIQDDNSQRLVENLAAVAWNGCEIAFKVLQKRMRDPDLATPHRAPIKVTLLGSGGVGTLAVQAAIRYGDPQLWQSLAKNQVPGNIVQVLDYDLTSHKRYIQDLLSTTTLLIDATQRKNPAEIIIPNSFVGLLPDNAVILDLSVDPYDFSSLPHEVKGIEGIPQGDLDQYIFAPDDPAWDALPQQIITNHRRWVVSCYSWPGIHPRACMLRYGNQISPLLRTLASAGGIEGINPGGRHRERALARGLLKFWPD